MIYDYANMSTDAQQQDGNNPKDQVAALEKYGCQQMTGYLSLRKMCRNSNFNARNQILPGIIWVTSAFQARDPMMIGGDPMADRDAGRNEELRRNVVEKMWLHYFNNSLLEQGLISESAHRKMKVQISTRKPTDRTRDTGNLELS